MKFSDSDLKQYLKDEKGFKGECYFDSLIDQSPASTYIQLRGLLLQWQNKTFQIDSILIGPHKIYLNDVKTFEGEVYIEGEQWFYMSGLEINNPLHQLRRSVALFRPLIQSIGLNLPVEARAVFVHPEFTLFQADRNLSIILPSQLNSYVKRLGSVTADTPLIEAANKLASLHIQNSPFDKANIPAYSYESLKKGIACDKCKTLSIKLDGRKLACSICDYKEDLELGIIRTVKEHQLLFPERLITVSGITDWCGLNIERNRLRLILKAHFQMVGQGKAIHYI